MDQDVITKKIKIRRLSSPTSPRHPLGSVSLGVSIGPLGGGACSWLLVTKYLDGNIDSESSIGLLGWASLGPHLNRTLPDWNSPAQGSLSFRPTAPVALSRLLSHCRRQGFAGEEEARRGVEGGG